VRELVVQIDDALIHWRSPGCYQLRSPNELWNGVNDSSRRSLLEGTGGLLMRGHAKPLFLRK
jgi:hypothetical protein